MSDEIVRVGFFGLINPFKRLPVAEFDVSLGTLFLVLMLALTLAQSDLGDLHPAAGLIQSVAGFWLGFRLCGAACRIDLQANSKDGV